MKNNKRLILLVTIAMALSNLVPLSQIISGNETDVYMSIEDIEIPVGASNTCSVQIHNVDGLGSFDLIITWDPNILDLKQVSKADFTIAHYIDHDGGYVNINGYSVSSVSGSFNLSYLEFQAIGISGDTCGLEIISSELLNSDPTPVNIPHETANGTVLILGEGLVVSAGGPYSGETSQSITLHASVSGGTQPYSFFWDLDDDGQYTDSYDQEPTWSWDSDGVYMIKLEVTDSTNTTVRVTTTVTVTTQQDNGSSGGQNGDTPDDNNIPIIIYSVSPTTQMISANISFDASESYDPDGDPVAILWEFGDSTKSTFPTTTHSYSSPGQYTVKLTVSDPNDGTNQTSIIISIQSSSNNPPSAPSIEGTSFGHMNKTYRYLFRSTDVDNDLLKYIIDWGDGETTENESTSASAEFQITHQWDTAGRYIISAYAHDGQTRSSNSTHTILIDARAIESIGYMTDDNADGIYDTFYDDSDSIQTKISKTDDGLYSIDSDGDGINEYTYDIKTGILSSVSGDEAEGGHGMIIFIALIVLVALVIIGSVLLLRRK